MSCAASYCLVMVATPESRAIAVLKVLNTEPSSYAPKVILLKMRSLASAGDSFGAEIADDLGQLLVKDELHAGVERQFDRPAIALDPAVERPLDPGEPVIVDPA